jgi:hypothetical protein
MQLRVRVTMLKAMLMVGVGSKLGGMADTAVAGVETVAAVDIAGMACGADVAGQHSAPERAS